MGYKSKKVDDLLDEARRTYVLEDRARLYREFQEVLATEPMLFAYEPRRRSAE
jgi:ABC-type transport system substrate-binding protein